MVEQLKEIERHESMRGYFAYALHEEMRQNQNIVVITGDLGFGMFDRIRKDYSDRFFNVGASEQAMVGIACGMAMEGKIPVVYSITPFLLARPYEWLRNYVNHEKINVKLVGSGRDNDYEHDGITHFAYDAKDILSTLPNIVQYWPEEKEGVEALLFKMLRSDRPSFLSLKR